MSTETKTTTRCDGPACDKTHQCEDPGVIERAWARLDRHPVFGIDTGGALVRWGNATDGSLDFCSPACLAAWANVAAAKEAEQREAHARAAFRIECPTSTRSGA